MLNLNRASLSLEPINTAIHATLGRVVAHTERPREQYLGASILGHECLRRIQFEWWCRSDLIPAQDRERFERGYYFERRMRQHLERAGFKFAPPEATRFTAVDGVLRGHADGIIIHGPDLPGAYLIYPFVWEHKALKAASWREIERDGLERRHSNYLVQVALYQAYLDIRNPALFRVTNAARVSGCTFLCRLTPSGRRPGATAPLTLSQRRALASCFRVGSTIPKNFPVSNVPIEKNAGDEK